MRWTLVGRFRDETGHAVAPGDLLRHAPRAFAEAVARVTVGWAPAAPLIGYSARRVIEREVLTAGCRIVEFGSGRSTPWFAARCGWLLSIEDDPVWYARVERWLGSGAEHVRHELRAGPRAYTDLSDVRDGSVDFALVDGRWRDSCVAAVVPKIRPGGAVYLDNSDTEAAAARLQAAATRVRRFTDFAPTHFFVEQGMLAWF